MKHKVTVLECDNPDCAKLVMPEELDTNWYQGIHLGKGFYHLEWGGGPLPALFACQISCVGPAIEHAITESRA